MAEPVKPSEGFDYYQGAIYWTNFRMVGRAVNQKISGNPEINWIEHTVRRYGKRKRALIVNCGNGWVERAFFKAGGLEHATGFDIIESNIATARQQAPAPGWQYVLGDCNTIGELGKFDLIINCGSMHHVAKIERLTHILAESLSEDGVYVNYDYVGPHRNQFGWDSWSRAVNANAALPAKYRANLRYPHLATMMASDPTEAIHSELQVEVMERYFDLIERTDLGGNVAYMILFENHALRRDEQLPEAQSLIQDLFNADQAELARDPAGNLFSYIVARANLDKTPSTQRAAFLAQEEAREAKAATNNGLYYPATPLELIYNDLAMAEYKLRINDIA